MTSGLEQGRSRTAAEVLAERDAIQANLLELDGSFVKQLLDGAALTGVTRSRWTRASAALAALWETYLAYSAVVDRIAVLAGDDRRPSRKELPELTGLLSGGCIKLPDAPAVASGSAGSLGPAGALGPTRRDLASVGRPAVTLSTAVGFMRRCFGDVTEVTSAVEAVWAAVGPPLDAAEAVLGASRPLTAGLGPSIEAELGAAEADLAALRSAANADPLALLSAGSRVDTAAAERLQAQASALGAKVAELDRLRSRARGRIEALAAAAGTARAERRAAIAAANKAAELVTVALPTVPTGGAGVADVPDIADGGEPRLAGLSALAAGGHWDRLQAELDRGEAELATAAGRTAEIRRLADQALARREELRGLLGAYKAKAGRLGASEDPSVAQRYDQARELLWSAPCDLTAAEAAVSGYQQAILTTEKRR